MAPIVVTLSSAPPLSMRECSREVFGCIFDQHVQWLDLGISRRVCHGLACRRVHKLHLILSSRDHVSPVSIYLPTVLSIRSIDNAYALFRFPERGSGVRHPCHQHTLPGIETEVNHPLLVAGLHWILAHQSLLRPGCSSRPFHRIWHIPPSAILLLCLLESSYPPRSAGLQRFAYRTIRLVPSSILGWRAFQPSHRRYSHRSSLWARRLK